MQWFGRAAQLVASAHIAPVLALRFSPPRPRWETAAPLQSFPVSHCAVDASACGIPRSHGGRTRPPASSARLPQRTSGVRSQTLESLVAARALGNNSDPDNDTTWSTLLLFVVAVLPGGSAVLSAPSWASLREDRPIGGSDYRRLPGRGCHRLRRRGSRVDSTRRGQQLPPAPGLAFLPQPASL